MIQFILKRRVIQFFEFAAIYDLKCLKFHSHSLRSVISLHTITWTSRKAVLNIDFCKIINIKLQYNKT